MSIDFNSYDYKFLPYNYMVPSIKSKYGIEAAAYEQLNKMALKKMASVINNENSESTIEEERVKIVMKKALEAIKEKERLEKICDQFLG